MLATSIYLLLSPDGGLPVIYGYTILGLVYLCLLLIAVTEKRGLISFVMRNQLLGKIGIISYGVYLLHLPVHAVVNLSFNNPAGVSITFNIIALLLTILLATISWIFFEKRIVNWGRSFRYKGVSSEPLFPERYAERQP